MTIRKLKMLGLCFVACLALGSTSAPVAAAEVAEFHSDGTPTQINGSGSSVFEFDGGKITCKEMSSAGELTELSSSILEMTPGTSSCTGFGSAVPGIDWNGCRMEYKASLDVGPPIRLTAKPGIRCPSTPTGQDEIVITVFESGVMKCSIHIPEQEVESGITLTNGEAKGVGDITMDHHIETLQYSQVAGEGLGKCANASGTKNGKYTGEITLTGRNGKGEATSIWAE